MPAKKNALRHEFIKIVTPFFVAAPKHKRHHHFTHNNTMWIRCQYLLSLPKKMIKYFFIVKILFNIV